MDVGDFLIIGSIFMTGGILSGHVVELMNVLKASKKEKRPVLYVAYTFVVVSGVIFSLGISRM